MRTLVLIPLILLTVLTICIEANCVCRINPHRKTVKVTKNLCYYGSVPQMRIAKVRYGLKTYKSCRCTCVTKEYFQHHSDYLNRIN